jgi:hypothetical protein
MAQRKVLAATTISTKDARRLREEASKQKIAPSELMVDLLERAAAPPKKRARKK